MCRPTEVTTINSAIVFICYCTLARSPLATMRNELREVSQKWPA